MGKGNTRLKVKLNEIKIQGNLNENNPVIVVLKILTALRETAKMSCCVGLLPRHLA